MSKSFKSLKVVEKVNETSDSSSFLLDISDEDQNYDYISGQYLTLKVIVNGTEERRAYSIFTSPSEKKFGFTVKRVDGGKVSNYLIDKVFEGDTIEVMPPEGKFVLKPNPDVSRDHYFIAGGSGITPIMSMIITLLEEEPKSTAYLLYANRTEDNIIFKEKFESLSERHKNQFFIEYILSQPKKEKSGGIKGLFGKASSRWSGLKGRIDNKCLTQFMDENQSKSNNDYFYLCGPGGLIETAENFLISKGIDKTNIKKEFFTSAHEVKENDTVPQIGGGDCMAKIQLNGESFEMKIPKDKTVLEALLDEGKDAPYSCTSGACSTCVAKVTNGKVEMDACFALDDEEIEKGFVLTCQSRVQTAELTLDFDA